MKKNSKVLPEISFNIAKQEALDYINRGEEKPGCIVKEVNPVIGKGLFANKEYTAGEFIMEYAGELINRKEGLKREKCYPLEKGSYIYFFLFDSKKFCLDATNSTKHGGYANDAAPDDTQHNAVMKCVSNKGRPHLALFAMRKIAAGEEVRYDYGVPNLPWRRKADDVLQCEAEGQHHENTLLKKCSVLLKRVSEKVLNKIRKDVPRANPPELNHSNSQPETQYIIQGPSAQDVLHEAAPSDAVVADVEEKARDTQMKRKEETTFKPDRGTGGRRGRLHEIICAAPHPAKVAKGNFGPVGALFEKTSDIVGFLSLRILCNTQLASIMVLTLSGL
ncbi:uncharacterized protein LOC130049773 [Ostrea edulis]|uniref:uncharacterized protein LOC130049773 n=1 Tax=Ostrea edulis TaxID=37623 RepID=UPI0024AE94FC|nr:uncharacterized protein LOC130049773 [Ostrea edulis]